MISTASDCCLWLDEVYFAPIRPSLLINGLQLIYASSQQRSSKSAPAEFKSEVGKKKKERPSLHGPIIPTVINFPPVSFVPFKYCFVVVVVVSFVSLLVCSCLLLLYNRKTYDINGNFTSDRGYRFQTRCALLVQGRRQHWSITKGTDFKARSALLAQKLKAGLY